MRIMTVTVLLSLLIVHYSKHSNTCYCIRNWCGNKTHTVVSSSFYCFPLGHLQNGGEGGRCS